MKLILSKLSSKNIIKYFIINESNYWSKRVPKVKNIIEKVLKNPLHFTNKKCKKYEINFLLTNNKKIKFLNKKYRNIFKPTDILTFSSLQKIDNNENIKLCDIVLSAEFIKKDSLKMNIDFYDRLTHLIIHGLLHNNGYKHDTFNQRKKMNFLEKNILKNLNIKYLI